MNGDPDGDPDGDPALDHDCDSDVTASGGGKMSTLDERQRAILDFERQWWKHAGAKEQAIRTQFQLSPTRYYQLLNALLDEAAALAYDPVTVGRLRRVRATRSRARGGRPR